MSPTQRFRLNTPAVASQVIDGEAILIHFETGCYYSTDALGAKTLTLLEHKPSLSQLLGELADHQTSPPQALRASVLAFLEQLQEEQLIVLEPASEQESRDENVEQTVQLSSVMQEPPVPILRKYADLQDILLLDPIHDTSETGWPVAKADPMTSRSS